LTGAMVSWRAAVNEDGSTFECNGPTRRLWLVGWLGGEREGERVVGEREERMEGRRERERKGEGGVGVWVGGKGARGGREGGREGVEGGRQGGTRKLFGAMKRLNASLNWGFITSVLGVRRKNQS
jgi:hypothetical protein